MAITEACQLWIEQRIQEELESQEETGKSLRAIGKEIAKEIERIFQAKVNPGTIKERARRMLVGTNVPPPVTLQEDKETPENQSPEPEIKAPWKHRATGKKRGGAIDVAGLPIRKSRPRPI
jgi:hypothetical protein